MFTELSDEVTRIVVSTGRRNHLDRAIGSRNKIAGLGHTPLDDPLFDNAPSSDANKAWSVGRRVSSHVCHIFKPDGRMKALLDKLKNRVEL